MTTKLYGYDDLISCVSPVTVLPDSLDRVAFYDNLLWPQERRKVHVRFLDGDERRKRYVEWLIRGDNGWGGISNFDFIFDNSVDAELRITFSEPYSWAYEGTSILYAPADMPTMALAIPYNAGLGETDNRIVLHEFGHILGWTHEHLHPNANIPWNISAVYEYYGAKGWSKQRIDSAILTPIASSSTLLKPYDPLSVMHYSIDPRLLTDPSRAVGYNNVLSHGDIDNAQERYGVSDLYKHIVVFPAIFRN